MRNCSVLILTKNEEKDLSGCLNSVSWSNDIVVYDSYSDDRTIEMAKEFGARVIHRPNQNKNLIFGGDESYHRNWGLRNIIYKNEWTLIIDADERIESNFIKKFQTTNQLLLDNFSGFNIKRKDFFMKKYLKNCQQTSMYTRLVKVQKCSYERIINPILKVNGSVGFFDTFLMHYPFSKGIKHWIIKHNNYSDLEAKQIISDQISFYSCIKNIFLNFGQTKLLKLYLKKFYYKLPARPILRFIYLYLFKKGFLDGKAGFNFAFLMLIYEFFISLKINEIKNSNY